MSILSTMTIGECVISTEIATFSSISAALSSKQDMLADAQISAIDSVVSSRATEIIFDDGTVSSFNWAGEIDQHTMVDAGLYDFYWIKKPVGVKFGNAVTSIVFRAFLECSQLKSITIPESVVNIGENAFTSCSRLKNITIPESVVNIGENAFSNCSSLSSITIPQSVVRIDSYAFSSCASLTSLIFKGKRKQQVEAMSNYPWGIEDTSAITTWNDASQEMVDSKLSGYVQTSAFGELQTQVTSLESIVGQANATLEEIV